MVQSMRALRCILFAVLGAVAGFVLGIAAPVALYLAMAWRNPEMQRGGGTPFSLLIIFTAPGGGVAGAVCGAMYGARPLSKKGHQPSPKASTDRGQSFH
jgi:hypothetical protein